MNLPDILLFLLLGGVLILLAVRTGIVLARCRGCKKLRDCKITRCSGYEASGDSRH